MSVNNLETGTLNLSIIIIIIIIKELIFSRWADSSNRVPGALQTEHIYVPLMQQGMHSLQTLAITVFFSLALRGSYDKILSISVTADSL